MLPSGRSFLWERDRSRPLAAYPRRPRRGGPPLAAYLALLRPGFTLPRLLPDARWALTPPFHPYRPSCNRRCIFCGTFRRPPPKGDYPKVADAQALPGGLPSGARTFLAKHEAPRDRPADRSRGKYNTCRLHSGPLSPRPLCDPASIAGRTTRHLLLLYGILVAHCY